MAKETETTFGVQTMVLEEVGTKLKEMVMES